MQKYIALVHQEGDSAYGVQFPDVPGCFSAADDYEELLTNASEALALHLEGEEPPMARPLPEIMNEDAIKEEVSKGALLIVVPYICLSGRTTKANITMDAGLLSAVDETAKQRKLTRSSYLADLARRDIYGQ